MSIHEGREQVKETKNFMQIEITKYGARFWAVYVNGLLLCVTVYKKGAVAVRNALLGTP